MSGYDDPYRYPREQPRGDRFDTRPRHYDAPYDERGSAHSYADNSYGYGGQGDWRAGPPPQRYDDRGRHPREWEDENRGYKRPRYHDEGTRYDAAMDPQHPYPPHQEAPQGYYAPQMQGYPTPPGGRDSRGDSAGPAARRKGAELESPSASVILLGLPPHVDDVLLRNFLEDMGASIDSTTVIMDRQTGLSKCFGFAKFSSVEHARSFVEPNFPSIPWRERSGAGSADGTRIKINYSQKTGGWRSDQGASARLSEDQRASTGAASQSFYMNDGTRDIGTTPSNMLLLRGLDPLTNEDDIAASLSRVGGRPGQDVGRGGLKRVMLVKDRASRSSWGFAFVQLADTRLATDVLAAAFNPHFHPTGFRIRNSIVAASFSHEKSFVPLYSPSPWSFKGEGGVQLAYWDDKGFAQPWNPPPTPDHAAELKGAPKAPRAQEEAKAEADLAAIFDSIEAELPLEGGYEAPAPSTSEEASVSESAPTAPAPAPTEPAPAESSAVSAPAAPAAPAALPPKGAAAPISIKPISAVPTGTPSFTTNAFPPASRADTSASSTAPAVAAPGEPTTPAPAIPAAAIPLEAKEKKGDLIVSRKAAPNLAKWNKKAKELRSAKPAPAASAAPSVGTAPSKAAPAAPAAPVASTSQTPVAGSAGAVSPAPSASPVPVSAFDDPEFAHGDPISFQCLLCQRQFKSIEELRKHNKLSQLHKAHIPQHSCTTRKAAAAKKYAAMSDAASGSTKPKYVDRAAARRVALGVSDELQHGQNTKKRKLEGPEPPKPEPVAPNKDGLEESNAGRKMLEKMGWSAGGGLGAEGAGRVDPVQAAQFQRGAGLGATKGVAVGSDEAATTYADRMREKALQRFNS
ncbi:hypothetical protein JCM8202_002669 [Rhodotorula sphaerocarpa]